MIEKVQKGMEEAREAHDRLLKIGKVTVDFTRIERATHYPQERAENDAEHSFHLALSAVEIAATYHPELDVGLVSRFSLVHDLPEVYAGDVKSFGITPEARRAKEEAEKAAVNILLTELPPHLSELLRRYEEQEEPEARFVRFIDKLLPAIIHSVAPDANRDVFKNTYGIHSVEEVLATRDARSAQLKAQFPEFDFIHIVRDLVSATSRERIFGTIHALNHDLRAK